MRGAAPNTAPNLAGRERPQELTYYEKLGRASDWIVRCKDCRKLVTLKVLYNLGTCPCGNRKVTEIITLTLWEWLKIRTGWIDFPHRAEFLALFSAGRRK